MHKIRLKILNCLNKTRFDFWVVEVRKIRIKINWIKSDPLNRDAIKFVINYIVPGDLPTCVANKSIHFVAKRRKRGSLLVRY